MLISHCYSDFLLWCHACSWPLATVWGDMAHTFAMQRQCVELLRGPVLQQDSLLFESFGLPLGISIMGSVAYHLNMPAEQRATVAACMSDYETTWKSADATIDTSTSTLSGMIRPRGATTKGQHWLSVQQLSWLCKCSWYLCAKDPGVAAAEVMATLPSIEDIIEMSPCLGSDTLSNWGFFNPLVNVACVWEKLGRPEDALRYATAALENDLECCGTIAPSVRIFAHMVQGRAQASVRHTQAASDAFEAAVELADKHGLRFLKALALKDLKLCVYEPLGHDEDGSRRLGEALRLLVGPADMLTPLMDGLNVAGLMQLPARSQERVQCGEEEVKPLRTDLAMLKVKALKRRAREAGVSEELLDDADDADDIKSAVIQLILDAKGSVATRTFDNREAS